MGNSAKEKISQQLKKLKIVKWDKFEGDIEGELIVYGWISRYKNSPEKDFVIAQFKNGDPINFFTSSFTFVEFISDTLGIQGPHKHNQRVDGTFDIDNCTNTPREDTFDTSVPILPTDRFNSLFSELMPNWKYQKSSEKEITETKIDVILKVLDEIYQQMEVKKL